MDNQFQNQIDVVIRVAPKFGIDGFLGTMDLCNHFINYQVYSGNIPKREKEEYCKYAADKYVKTRMYAFYGDAHKEYAVYTMMKSDNYDPRIISSLYYLSLQN